ncbi:uncharacterized protein [Clytia hemisphaerica]|uniref:F-box domain-containing protein n=1 Tax=Clytia hemisphaerica TaxID=252671 RepID=A0A7M5VF52_9CNID|eukprot:TCONS_00051487-protein
MDHLPLEILFKILKACSFDDIQHLACSSQFFRKTTRSILWKKVTIPLNGYAELKDKPLEALQNTRSIIFKNDFMTISPTGGVQMLEKILPHCNKSKIDLLSFNSIFYKNVIPYTLAYFDHVETLEFDSCSYLRDNCPPIDRIPTYKVLSFNGYTRFDEQIIRQNHHLEEIIINHGCSIDTGEIQVLGKATSLKKLELCCVNQYEHSQPGNYLNFKPLGQLTNLTFLDLSFCYIPKDSFQELCKKLAKLEVLKLFHSSTESEALKSLKHLESLKELEIVPPRYHNMTIEFFKSLKASTTLREITFHFTMCRGEDRQYVACLNSFNSLKKINIRSPGEIIDDIILDLDSVWEYQEWTHAGMTFCNDIGTELVIMFAKA